MVSVLLLTAGAGTVSAERKLPAIDRDAIESLPLSSNRDTRPDLSRLFDRLSPEQTGINFIHRWTPPTGKDGTISPATWASFASTYAGASVAIGDFDADGWPDVYLTRSFGGNRLYRNLGDFHFEDVTEKAGVANEGNWGTGAAFADIDNDGDLDLYVCNNLSPNRLYVNQGDGTFTDQAKLYGLDYSGASVMMSFADYDLDGDLDGYLLTNRDIYANFDNAELVLRDGKLAVPQERLEAANVLHRPDGKIEVVSAGQYDHLYRNDGEASSPRFINVSADAGIGGNDEGLSAIWWDYDNDGLPDLYVANDFYGPDHLYHNNGDGSFKDVTKAALPHTTWFSMGADAADINNDGLLDYVVADMAGRSHYSAKLGMGQMNKDQWFLVSAEPRQYMRNAVFLNSGTDRFMEAAHLTRLVSTGWTWAVKLADLD